MVTTEIALTRGYIALVDDADVDLVRENGPWHALVARSVVYANHSARWPNGRPRALTMHRLLMPTHKLVDHINGVTLDNRRSNLRPATHRQNQINQRMRAGSRSGYKGVTLGSRGGYEARCDKRWLGWFPTAEFAALAYDEAARNRFGEFARVNFP